MKFRRQTSLAGLVLGLIAFVAVWLGDAHLHLCFDGQEPPAAVHFADASVHNDAQHSEGSHQDRDVDVLDAAFVKKFGDAKNQPLLLLTLLIFWPVTGEPQPRLLLQRGFSRWQQLFRLKPPLRGPPLQHS